MWMKYLLSYTSNIYAFARQQYSACKMPKLAQGDFVRPLNGSDNTQTIASDFKTAPSTTIDNSFTNKKNRKAAYVAVLILVIVIVIAASIYLIVGHGHGKVSGQPTTTIQANAYSVPITITNNQNTPSPAPFQQLIGIDDAMYSPYIRSNWTNVEFSTGPNGSGVVLQAWVQANASANANYTPVWIKLPDGIGANSSITIYMDFMPSAVMSASGPTGEAPQLSSTYGQYDDGRHVFTFYDNFAGTTLNSSDWGTFQTNAVDKVTVHDGLNITNTAQKDNIGIYSRAAFPYPFYFEWYEGGNDAYSTWGLANSNGASIWSISGYSITYMSAKGHGVTEYTSNATTATINPSVGGAMVVPSLNSFVWDGETQIMSYNTASLANGLVQHNNFVAENSKVYLYIVNTANSTSSQSVYLTSYWVRVRAFPPGNAMPRVRFGAIT